MRKDPVCHSGARPVKQLHVADALSPEDLTRLLQAFTAGKTEILEDEALTLVQRASAQRRGAMLVEMILAGDLVPSVHEGQVCVALPGRPHDEA